jgi:hypothetical protein
MNQSDFEAMAIEHFGLTPQLRATTATLTNLAAFAAKAYELGLKDGRYAAPKTRKAMVYVRRETQRPSLKTVEAYLPSNYTARYHKYNGDTHILIEGEDKAGWTLDGYVIPRLGSGLIIAKEV